MSQGHLEHPRPMRIERLGLVSYGSMLARQEKRHQEVVQGATDTLFLLEHAPVITTGRNTQQGHVLAGKEVLLARGVSFFETGRGGDVTYHGPGQLVGYPIVSLQAHEQDMPKYVYALEETLIRTAADYGVVACRVPGLRGIWVGNDKLAAIGVRLAHWTTMHGFALNVNTRLEDFELIVPCGLHGKGVTSLQKLLHRPVDMHEVQDRIVHHIGQALTRDVQTMPTHTVACLAPRMASPMSERVNTP